MKVVIAGGSGSLGRRLCAFLAAKGHDIVVLSRKPAQGTYRMVYWDGSSVGAWADELHGAAVVNLAGELVDRRPTARNLELLTKSRTQPTLALVEASKTLPAPVKVWIQASTIAIYGDGKELILDEASDEGEGPPQMVEVARAWEQSVLQANATRTILLRTSVVLDRDTPALNRLLSVTRWGLGGKIGSGRQWFSWIHIDDWLNIVGQSLTDELIKGVFLATSPNPVRNSDLMRCLRLVMRRPPAPPTPKWLVRIGSVVLRTDPALALTGRRTHPVKLQRHGFQFSHPELLPALRQLIDP